MVLNLAYLNLLIIQIIAADAFKRLTQFFGFGTQGDTDIPVAVAAEDKARRYKHLSLIEQFVGEPFARRRVIRDAPPQEHTSLGRIETASELVHYIFGNLAALGVDVVKLIIPVITGFESLGRSKHHGLELPGVDVALHLQQP